MRVDRTRIDDRLFVGGLMAYAAPLDGVDLAVNVACELASDEDESVVHVPLRDASDEDESVVHVPLRDASDVESQQSEILRAVGLIVAARAAGRVVLVTCSEGRNRSCLVAAEVLIAEGMEPAEAVAAVRVARSPDAPRVLSNEAFVRWLCRERSS